MSKYVSGSPAEARFEEDEKLLTDKLKGRIYPQALVPSQHLCFLISLTRTRNRRLVRVNVHLLTGPHDIIATVSEAVFQRGGQAG